MCFRFIRLKRMTHHSLAVRDTQYLMACIALMDIVICSMPGEITEGQRHLLQVSDRKAAVLVPLFEVCLVSCWAALHRFWTKIQYEQMS